MEQLFHLRLFDSRGRVVREGRGRDLRDLKPGVFLLLVLDESGALLGRCRLLVH